MFAHRYRPAIVLAAFSRDSESEPALRARMAMNVCVEPAGNRRLHRVWSIVRSRIDRIVQSSLAGQGTSTQPTASRGSAAFDGASSRSLLSESERSARPIRGLSHFEFPPILHRERVERR